MKSISKQSNVVYILDMNKSNRDSIAINNINQFSKIGVNAR